MFVYVGRTYTSTVTASRTREVRCEKCGQTYFYEMIRTGVGQGTSAYMLNNSGAAAGAKQRAQTSVGKALSKGSDLVPCPNCGWFQSEMVRDARKERHGWLRVIAYGVPVLALVVCLIAFIDYSSSRRRSPDTPQNLLLTMLAAIGVGGAVLYLRKLVASRFDPNRTFPGPSDPLPGMPPALRPVPPVIPGGEPALLPVSRRQPELDRRGWLVVQIPRVVWPPHCAGCMGPATTNYAPSLRVASRRADKLPLPLCESCARALKRRTLRWALFAWPISIAVVAGVFLVSLRGDPIVACIFGGIVGCIVAAVMMFVLPSFMVRPTRLRPIDPKRAIYRLKYENPRYTEMIARFYDDAPVAQAFAQPATGGFPVLPASSPPPPPA